MRLFAALVAVLFLAVPMARAQQDPDDQYVIIYTLIQQGDANVQASQPQQALENYAEAQRELQKFATAYPDWNPTIVNYRLNYLAQKIAALTPQSPQTPATNAPPPNAPSPLAPVDLQAQVTSLNERIQRLQSDNETLQAKLKEALSVQPATVSASAFAQLQEQARELAKENDLLKATTTQTTNAAPVGTRQSNSQLEEALAAQTARANQLVLENQALQARVQSLTPDANAAEALREENALLKKELANIGTTPAGNDQNDLTAARAQIEQLQSDAAANWLEKMALEDRVKELQEASVNSVAIGSTPDQADLQSLENQGAAARIDALSKQVETLKARVAVDEAQAVPYTPQELALFKPGPLTANTNAGENSIYQLPSGSAVLVAEAENYFSDGEYSKAAADYQKILRHDKNNPLALANLAAIEVEENKLADADKHIQAALARQPDDSFNLTVLGRVKFSEGDFNSAIDALDRAAQLDPQNPQIQNYLGVALAQKGLRIQAETAFRKAIQIDPNYGDAQKNLAIIYLTAKPPLVELARWHYEKALAAGEPPNPDLEKMLNADSNASAQK